MNPAAGKRERYQLIEELGRGGMGVVYRALDRDLNREVAIKTLLERPDSATLDLFRKEWSALSSLNHPNIVDVYDIGELEGGRPYFVMPLLVGLTLDKLIKDHPEQLAPERVVEIVAQACKGLHAAHERGVVHRDLKPSNIFVLDDDSVIIIDFGIVHLVGETSMGGLKGTPFYMSPEQLNLEQVTAQSDIFSLAVVCYEALARRRPFAGGSLEKIVEAIRKEMPAPVSDLNPAVRPTLSQALHIAMAKQPRYRFQSAREFAAALRQGLIGETIERLNPAKLEPRLRKAREQLDASQFEVASDMLSGIEAEGFATSEVRALRREVDRVLRNRAVSRLVESARMLATQEEFDLASEKLTKALERDSTNPDALALRAEIETRRGVSEVERCLDVARQHIDAGTYDQARQAINRALHFRPGDQSARLLLNEVARLERERQAGEKERDQLYKAGLEAWSRGEITLALNKAERLMLLTEGREAVVGLDRADSFRTLYEEVRAAHDAVAAIQDEVRAHLAAERFNEADAACQRGIDSFPSHAVLQSLRFEVAERHRKWTASAVAAVETRIDSETDLAVVAAILEEATLRFPGEARLQQALIAARARRDLAQQTASKARALEDRGQLADALSQWETLRNMHPAYPGIDFECDRLRAACARQAKDEGRLRLLDGIDAALDRGDYAEALSLAGAAEGTLAGDDELEALKVLAEQGLAWRIEADSQFAHARDLLQHGETAAAITTLEAALRLDSHHAGVRALLGETLVAEAARLRETKPPDAEKLLRQAIELDSSNSRARDLLLAIQERARREQVTRRVERARGFVRLGNRSEALKEVHAALVLAPNDPELLALRDDLSPPPPPPELPPPVQPATAKPPLPPPVPPRPAVPATPAKPHARSRNVPPALLAVIAAVAVLALGAALWSWKGRTPVKPAAPGLVEVILSADPSDASIKVDGKPITGLRVELEPRTYSITVSRPGYRETVAQLTVTAGLGPQSYKLEPLPAMIRVAMSPGWKARLDDREVAVSEGMVSEPVPPGAHRLDLETEYGPLNVRFETAPAAIPRVLESSKIRSNVTAAVIGAMGNRAVVYWPSKAGLNNITQDVGEGLTLDVPQGGGELTIVHSTPLKVPFGPFDETPSLHVRVTDLNQACVAVTLGTDDAEVFVNGIKSIRPPRNGVWTSCPTPGSYAVSIRREGFHPWEQSLMLKKGVNPRYAAVWREIERFAALELSGGPAGADAILDGNPIGRIGADGRLVAQRQQPGAHVLRIVKEGFEPREITITLATGRTQVLSGDTLRLRRQVAITVISNAPAAEMTWRRGSLQPQPVIDGRVTLPPGDYTFDARAQGFQNRSVPVTVPDQPNFRVELNLTPVRTPTGPVGPTGVAPLRPNVAGIESVTGLRPPDRDGWRQAGKSTGRTIARECSIEFAARFKGTVRTVITGKKIEFTVRDQAGRVWLAYSIGDDKLKREGTGGAVSIGHDLPKADFLRLRLDVAPNRVMLRSGNTVLDTWTGAADFSGGLVIFDEGLRIRDFTYRQPAR